MRSEPVPENRDGVVISVDFVDCLPEPHNRACSGCTRIPGNRECWEGVDVDWDGGFCRRVPVIAEQAERSRQLAQEPSYAHHVV